MVLIQNQDLVDFFYQKRNYKTVRDQEKLIILSSALACLSTYYIKSRENFSDQLLQ